MKILIVDDIEINRSLLKHYLSTYNNIVLIEAENGQEAIDIFNNDSIDLIFMDIMMPVMNGIDATIEIKKIQPDLPIIAITAYRNNNSIEYDCFDMVLEKPINFTTIRNIINKYL